MADYTFNYGTTAAQIRTFLLNEYSNANYGAGNVLSFSILPTVPDQGIPQIGVYNFTITLEFDNIAGTFEVKDLTPPTLSIANRFLNFYTSEFPSGVSAAIQTQEMLAQITVSDNLTPVGDILISFDRNRVNLTTPGTSQTYGVRAIDNAGNVSPWQYFTLQYIDDTTDTIPPTISASVTNFTFYRSSFANSVPANEIQYLIDQFTTVSDNTGFAQRVISPTITQWSPSSWPAFRQYQVKAVDATGNESPSITMNFEYIDDVLASQDTTPPSLTLTKVIYDYFVSEYPNGVTSAKILQDVNANLTATDDSGTVFLTFTPTVQSITTIPPQGQSVSFSYSVRASDPSNNLSDPKTFTVNLINNTTPPPPVDTTPPQIIGPSSVTFIASEQRDVNYLLTLYTLFDDSGVVSWYQMVNFIWQTLGTYQFQLKAIDGSGNIAFRNITVTVISSPPPPDITPPSISGSLSVTVFTSQSLNTQLFLDTYYNITDISGVASKTLSPAVDFANAGTYQTVIFATDSVGNTSRFPVTEGEFVTVIVVDDTADPETPSDPTIPTDNIINGVFIEEEEVTSKVKVGLTFIDRIDVELDSGSMIIPFSTRSEPYKPFTKVFINFKNVGEPEGYYISDDSVTIQTAASLRYQHQILLIEPTKILERFKCVDMSFTQPIDSSFEPYTLLDVVERIYNNNPNRPSAETQGHWTSIDPVISNLLAGVKSPQLQFRSMTVREALDRAFQYINAVARLKLLPNGNLVLTADFFNDLDSLTLLENRINESKSLSSEFYAENSELIVENATTEYATVSYPSYGWAGVRTTGSIINSENYFIEVPFPIYEIKSLKIFLRVQYTIIDSSSQEQTLNEYREVDITPYVFEKPLYDGLQVGTPARQLNGELHSFNTLYYTQGDNKILNLGNIANISAIGFLNNRRVIDLLLENVFRSNLDEYQVKYNGLKFSDLLFRIEYRTLLTSRLRFMRDIKEDTFGTIHTNQMENIVDLESLGANARGIINRVGNPELTVTKIAKSWEDRFKVGQFTEDNYIITTVENSVFNDHIKSTAQFTKNYNGLSRFVGVDTQIRQIPIPFGSVKSLLHYDQFVMLSDSTIPLTTPGNFAGDLFLTSFGDYLKQITTKNINDEVIIKTNVFSLGTKFTVPDKTVVEVGLLRDIPSDSNNPVLIIIATEEAPNTPIFSEELIGADDFDFAPIQVTLEPNKTYIFRMFRDIFDTSYAELRLKLANPIQFDKYMVFFRSYGATSPTPIATVSATPDISAVNNSIKIDFGFNDNLNAGFEIDNTIGGGTAAQFITGQKQVFYTSSIGRFNSYDFKVAKLIDPVDPDDRIALANRLPRAFSNDFDSALFETPNMRYRKDNAELFGLTYQLHFLPTDEMNNHIIMGKKFVDRFFGGTSIEDITFKVYTSDETYTKFENEKAKGTKNTSENAYTITVDTNNRWIKIQFNLNLTNAKSFAIGTDDGDLVLGFNQINPYTNQYKDLTTIYLNFTNKRS